MINTFEFKRHICMVFELCDMNLRDMLRLKNNQGGIGLNLVKLYARQLLIAFALVHKLKIIHADCNILFINFFYIFVDFNKSK